MLPTWQFFELRSIGYYGLFLAKFFLQSGAAKALLWSMYALCAGVVAAFFTILFMPRIVEDYVKIYNWYINSDFFVIFEEKVDVRFFFKLLALPFLLLLHLLVMMLNLIVRFAYQLTFKLNLLRCVNCSSVIEWKEGTVICHICTEKVTGDSVKTCPGCNFKANAIRCPYCGYVVFVGLLGQHPTSIHSRKKA
jgi:hypothetical protein